MSFLVKPTISQSNSIKDFFADWGVNEQDLIITNDYVLSPHLGGEKAPCDVLFQEQHGSGEPNDEMVDSMLSAASGKDYRRVIAIGGGTVIDISKLFVFGNNLKCEEIFEQGVKLERKRDLLILPTTCGTGSEATNISIIEFKQKQTKVGLAIPALYADEAVLIPALLSTIPYDVFAASSIDALIHATESYVSPKANDFTRALGKAAITKILQGYMGLTKNQAKGTLPEDMEPYLTASTMAGIAFGNAGCAAVHALSYPIGGIYHVPHGKANYLVFEAVFKGYQKLGADISILEKVYAEVLDCKLADVWKTLFGLLDKVLDRAPLRELGIDQKQCAEMADSVIKNQQRLLANNPVQLSQKDIEEIYLSCL